MYIYNTYIVQYDWGGLKNKARWWDVICSTVWGEWSVYLYRVRVQTYTPPELFHHATRMARYVISRFWPNKVSARLGVTFHLLLIQVWDGPLEHHVQVHINLHTHTHVFSPDIITEAPFSQFYYITTIFSESYGGRWRHAAVVPGGILFLLNL